MKGKTYLLIGLIVVLTGCGQRKSELKTKINSIITSDVQILLQLEENLEQNAVAKKSHEYLLENGNKLETNFSVYGIRIASHKGIMSRNDAIYIRFKNNLQEHKSMLDNLNNYSTDSLESIVRKLSLERDSVKILAKKMDEELNRIELEQEEMMGWLKN